ncbi:MAG: tRNA (adenosine(37)-N6)-threonylcarbamoyltransferase complex transferase subunit TsaD [bacterium]
MIVLGIETTCDETSVSLVRYSNRRFEILSNVVLSQDIHQLFGGVYPEQAFRKHQENLVPILSKALEVIDDFEKIDLVGVSAYPGLVGALACGVAVAKVISGLIDKPVMPVNHLWAHILVNFTKIPEDCSRYLGLVISGGHTNAFLIDSLLPLKIRSISGTLDDAVGEAFDKVARMLGLGFPGGPIIDKLANSYEKRMKNFSPLFPVPDPSGYSFSYSGLKTAVMRYLKDKKDFDVEEICFYFRYSAIKHIINKLQMMVREFGVSEILIGGGVAANSFLRQELDKLSKDLGLRIRVPPVSLCTDNAAMVAIASTFLFLSNCNIDQSFDVYPSQEEGNRIWNIE